LEYANIKKKYQKTFDFFIKIKHKSVNNFFGSDVTYLCIFDTQYSKIIPL
jgi:hypothetical protein